MQILQPYFTALNYKNGNIITNPKRIYPPVSIASGLNAQPTETFTKTPHFGTMTPFKDSKGNLHTYLPEGIHEAQLPDANTVFKEGTIEDYKAMYQAFYTAAYIGDTRMVSLFLKKNYDPTLKKSTPGIYTDCKPRDSEHIERHCWTAGMQGKTAYELAEQKGHSQIIQRINKHLWRISKTAETQQLGQQSQTFPLRSIPEEPSEGVPPEEGTTAAQSFRQKHPKLQQILEMVRRP